MGGESPAEENEIISGFSSRLDKLESGHTDSQVRLTEMDAFKKESNDMILANTAKLNTNTGTSFENT